MLDSINFTASVNVYPICTATEQNLAFSHFRYVPRRNKARYLRYYNGKSGMH